MFMGRPESLSEIRVLLLTGFLAHSFSARRFDLENLDSWISGEDSANYPT